MLKSKSFVKITRKNKVVKVVREHYLRDDVWCGSDQCTECQNPTPKLTSSMNYLILDTNAILHQKDLIQNPKIKNVIILQTVLEEVRSHSFQLYNIIREIAQDDSRHFYVFSNEFHRGTYVERASRESPNDRNDRAIRAAAKWFTEHLADQDVKVLLLTNDQDNLAKALKEKIDAKTVAEYIRSLNDPELIDILALSSTTKLKTKEEMPSVYPEHLSPEEVEEGLRKKKLHQGPMRQNLDNWLEANVPVDGLDEDVLIRGRMHMNRAFDGDLVVVELLPRDQWRRASKLYVDAEEPDVEHVLKCDSVDVESNDNKSPSKNRADRVNEPRPTGRVVAIIKRNWKTYCGTIEPMTGVKDDSYLFTATDPRVPRVLLKTLQGPTLLDKRIVVSVDDWLFNEPHPRGHFVRTLDGTVGTIATESEALLLQHNVSFAPFSEPVRACLPHNWKVTPLDLEERMDLRATHRVFSIDPPGCTDIDDALHAHPLPNGNFSVGVHIADVSHFIKEGTALDREAQARGTSVYLTNKRIDMVPRELGEDVCSLNCQVDRFAFSVIWEMTPEAEIKDTVFAKTIIKSVHSFSYEEAQKRMDNKELNDEVTLDIRRLNSLARVLRKRRMDNGALTLSSPEVKFKRDEENENPVDVEMYQLRETNALVEEFMLLANIEVAKQIAKMFPAFGLLRRHPSPRPSNFDFLKRAVGRFGFNLDVTTSKSLADSLDDINRTEDPYFNTLVRILTTRCMTPARYFASGSVTPKEFHHYGLAVPIYTHFTSPIRRYADVIVHRLLAASIGISPLTPKLNQRSIQKICDGINRKNRMAELASRESTRLFTHIFLKDRTITEQAYVTGVKQNGFSVIVPRYGIEGKVYIGSVKDAAKKFNFDEAEQVLQSLDGKTSITVFDKVTVQIRVDFTKKHLPKIIYRCMEPKLHEPFPEQSTTETQAKAASSPAPTSANVTPAKRKADSTTPTQNKKQKNK